jgi:hypothetical protein
MITEAQYVETPNLDGSKQTSGIRFVVDGEVAVAPINPENKDYAEIMRQVEAGELTIQDAD